MAVKYPSEKIEMWQLDVYIRSGWRWFPNQPIKVVFVFLLDVARCMIFIEGGVGQ